MKRKWMAIPVLALPILVGGFVMAGQSGDSAKADAKKAEGYTCPVTGEELPCPKCCPLNK